MAERNRGRQRRSDSRDRGDRNRGGGGKNSGGGDHHPRRGGDSASGAGVPEGAAEGATLVQQPGQLAAALGEATEGEGMAREDVQRRTARQPPSPAFVLEHGPQRGSRGSRQKVSRAMAGGASGPEAFTLLLRLLITHFDGVDTEEGYTKLYTCGMCNGMPFSGFSREFRVLVPNATGSERVLSPGTDVVLEVVRVAANERFPALLPALYPGSKATDPRPYASLDAMWRAFSD